MFQSIIAFAFEQFAAFWNWVEARSSADGAALTTFVCSAFAFLVFCSAVNLVLRRIKEIWK